MRKSILGWAVAAAMASAGNAMAGGLWLNEYGDFSGGRASAGASAGVDGASTIMHNPASSTRLKGNQLFVSAGAFLPQTKFDPKYTSPALGSGNGGDAGEAAPAGGSAYVHDFGSDRWSAGIYAVGLSGAGLDYDDDWVGRNQATKVNLLVAGVVPTLAYRVTDKLSIGVGVEYWYSNLNIHLRVPRIDQDKEQARASVNGDDTGFGLKLGSMYELTDRTRFGIAYQSKIDAKFDGDLKLVAPGGGILPPGTEESVSSRTELTLADQARFAMHHDLDEQWSVSLTLGWDNWSQLGDVPLSTDNRSAAVPARWHDTYHYAWGAEYRLDPRWAFTSGVAYDTNPVDAADRNAQLPLDRQVRYAFGTRYTISDSLNVGGYVNYVDLGRARIESKRWGGEYQDNGALQLVANLNWTF